MENVARPTRGRPRGFDKEEVAGKAAHLFWERGYEGVSVDELTEAMGITPQKLYAAFGSKEGVHREALAWYDREVTRFIRQPLADEPNVAQAIRLALRACAVAFTAPGRPAGCMRSTAGLAASIANVSIARQGRNLRHDSLAVLQSRLEEGVAAGQLTGGAPTGLLAQYLNAMVVGMAVAARDGAAEVDLLAMADMAAASLPVTGTDRGAST